MASQEIARKYAAWEKAHVLEADRFSVCLFRGSARFDVVYHKTMEEAFAAALVTNDEYGRFGLVYAVTPGGTSILLERSRWPYWREVMKEKSA